MVHTEQLYAILFSAYLIWISFVQLWMCSVSEMVQGLVKKNNKKLKIHFNKVEHCCIKKNQKCRNFLVKTQQYIFYFQITRVF